MFDALGHRDDYELGFYELNTSRSQPEEVNRCIAYLSYFILANFWYRVACAAPEILLINVFIFYFIYFIQFVNEHMKAIHSYRS